MEIGKSVKEGKKTPGKLALPGLLFPSFSALVQSDQLYSDSFCCLSILFARLLGYNISRLFPCFHTQAAHTRFLPPDHILGSIPFGLLLKPEDPFSAVSTTIVAIEYSSQSARRYLSNSCIVPFFFSFFRATCWKGIVAQVSIFKKLTRFSKPKSSQDL